MSHDSNTPLPVNTIDLTGQRFTRLVVLRYAGKFKGRAMWECQCDCGNIKNMYTKGLRNGTARSCGCLRKEMLQDPTRNPRPATVDLTGETIGYWLVLGHAGVRKGHTWWTCECICGTIRDVSASHLKREDSRSCGCHQGHFLRLSRNSHGMSYTAEYHAWSAMIQRCYNPNMDNYPIYGGRGITVCPEWRASFDAFFADMGPRPSPQHSLDRIDNAGGNYEKSNCRWTTIDVQAVNRRTTIWITYHGETHTANEWEDTPGCQARNIKARNILDRLRSGWPLEDAMTIPASSSRKEAHRRSKE